jgi:hypothetical protein
MASIIKADGGTESVDLVQGNAQLDQLQTIVGGYIEQVRLRNGDDMWVNEDGGRLKLEANGLASEIAEQDIVGNVVVTYPGEVE